MAGGSLNLPVVDLAPPDIKSAVDAVRKACVESGFFYVTNHGIQDGLLEALFAESKKFFELPLEEKMLLQRNSAHRGYTAPYTEKLDASSEFQGDLKESFYIGAVGDVDMLNDPNQWPPKERFPSWKDTMKLYHAAALEKRMENNKKFIVGEVNESDNGNYGASAHSYYGMITLLATDGTPGLQTVVSVQICREKDRHPQLWEDVRHVDGTLIVNIGDLLERWTNCVFSGLIYLYTNLVHKL
ncbi:unnamed protein product [Triticum turgidum subsp. durum]|uniref:Non-haem dioxygenase N-terminal domain-containing protein n=1 Tax=Triticum turgidum subsp. durum TaxID=4567 RepID=A0A9R0QV22_TRITD|nr:unnamed protein product [Triticum turgidum subsp. durum]